jgi:DNA repair exonuclease SbcCD nuclease subunit
VSPREGLASASFDLICFGHIHKAQVVNESPPLIYTGTPAVCNWGEVRDQHGVWIYDTADALRFVPIEDRAFITLEPSAEELIDTPEMLEGVAMEGATIRVKYVCDEEQARRIDGCAIRRSLMACGASKVVFRPTVERAVRARVEAMDESLDETAAFDLWLASQNGSVSVDPEALRALHDEFLERSKA